MSNPDDDAFLKEFIYGNSTSAVQQRRRMVKELEEKWAREKVRILIPVLGAGVLAARFLLLPVFAKDARDGMADWQ
jgi:hypothetical protein